MCAAGCRHKRRGSGRATLQKRALDAVLGVEKAGARPRRKKGLLGMVASNADQPPAYTSTRVLGAQCGSFWK